MPALCDVNVLLALVTDRHVHHPVALQWAQGVGPGEAILCRVSQLGLLRLLNNPAVMEEDALDSTGCWQTWRRLLQDERFRFVQDEPTGLNAKFEQFTSGRGFSPRLWNDAYLAAYAIAGALTMVTFDHGFRAFPSLSCRVLEPRPTPK